MKKYFAKLALLTFILSIFATNVLGQSQLFVWGDVRWSTGYPAIGLEVRLIRNSTNAIVRRSYTNPAGRYAFYGIAGRPSDYSLHVYTGNSMRGGIRVPNLPIGGKVRDIIVN
jgi:hypothetical protein